MSQLSTIVGQLFTNLGQTGDAVSRTGSANAKLAALLALHTTFSDAAGTVAAYLAIGGNQPAGFTSLNTVTNPSTTLTTAFNITGMGRLHNLGLYKGATAANVAVRYTLTIDGTAWTNDGQGTDSSLSARGSWIVGNPLDNVGLGVTAFAIDFWSSLQMQVRYSAASTENINVYSLIEYR